MNVEARSFLVADRKLRDLMIDQSRTVHTGTWQGRDIRKRPDAAMRELLNVNLGVDLRSLTALEHWRAECRPNLPWADDHFAERVSGNPLNPPPSWAWWPWAKHADAFRADLKFNHTYPERFWPKRAGGGRTRDPYNDLERLMHGDVIRENNRGIRFEYGDLNDVIELLRRDPGTRQAYLPIFFPEDTGVGDGGRKPCTLGYQFIVRGGKLHVFYPMRSCDLMRHFRDDAYLAVRLLLWVLDRLQADPEGSIEWGGVTPGTLTMHMTSLHCFVNDYLILKKERDDLIAAALA